MNICFDIYVQQAQGNENHGNAATNFAKIFGVKDYCLHCSVLNQLARFGTLLKKLENSYATICESWTRTAICWLKYNPCNKVFRLSQVYLQLSSCCLSDS